MLPESDYIFGFAALFGMRAHKHEIMYAVEKYGHLSDNRENFSLSTK